jgi:regulator of sigma E protease
MNDIATNLLAVVIVLGFLIFAHESGHFFVAKFFKVRVLVFSFGFGKRLFGFRHRDTDYRVSLVPLGGYVRMAGDSAEENVTGQPDEFLSKPKWQRFLILVAGPFMNILIAIAFMTGIAMIGFQQRVTEPVISKVDGGKAGAKAGLQPGDRIISVKGQPVDDVSDLQLVVSTNAGTPLRLVYERNGATRETTLTPDRIEGDYGPMGRAFVSFGSAPIVGSIMPGTPAATAGLRPGDHLVAINGKPAATLEDFVTASEATPKAPVTVQVARGAQTLTISVPPATGTDANLLLSRGIGVRTKLIKHSFIPALQYSVDHNWRMLKLAMSSLGRLFRPEGSVKELSGPINIARISGAMFREGWLPTIALMAMISLQLGVMNLLPIPVLDGGHIMILIVEGIARRDLSLRVKERIQQAGFAVLATLMIVVLYNDVITNVLRLKNGYSGHREIGGFAAVKAVTAVTALQTAVGGDRRSHEELFSQAGEHAIERRRHPVEVERFDERGGVAHLPVVQPAVQLSFQCERALSRLPLVRAERGELTALLDEPEHPLRS